MPPGPCECGRAPEITGENRQYAYVPEQADAPRAEEAQRAEDRAGDHDGDDESSRPGVGTVEVHREALVGVLTMRLVPPLPTGDAAEDGHRRVGEAEATTFSEWTRK